MREVVKQEIKEAVRRRDICCRTCGSTENLQVHEIKPNVISGEATLDDCTLLCWECHQIIHKYHGKINFRKLTIIGQKKSDKKMGRPRGSKDKLRRSRDGYLNRWRNRKRGTNTSVNCSKLSKYW